MLFAGIQEAKGGCTDKDVLNDVDGKRGVKTHRKSSVCKKVGGKNWEGSFEAGSD